MLRDCPLFPLRQEHDYKILLCFETGGTSARDSSTFENDRIASSIRWCSRWLQKYWLPLVFLHHFLILCPGLHHRGTFPLAVMIITWWCLEPYLDQCCEPFSSFHFPKLIVNLLPIFWNVWRRNHWNNTTCFLFSFTAYPFCSALVAHFPYFLHYKKWKNRSHYDMTV